MQQIPYKIGYSDRSGPDIITDKNDSPLVILEWGCSCCKRTIDKFSDLDKEKQKIGKFIIKACNNHKKLLKVLKFSLSKLENINIYEREETNILIKKKLNEVLKNL